MTGKDMRVLRNGILTKQRKGLYETIEPPLLGQYMSTFLTDKRGKPKYSGASETLLTCSQAVLFWRIATIEAMRGGK